VGIGHVSASAHVGHKHHLLALRPDQEHVDVVGKTVEQPVHANVDVGDRSREADDALRVSIRERGAVHPKRQWIAD
jgi:hypothetical protein